MGAGRGTFDRHVIPRWRSVHDTVAAGEFQRRENPRPPIPGHREKIDKLERRWEVLRTELAAAELVGAGLVAGSQTAASTDAAHILLGSDNDAYRRLGERVVGTRARGSPDVPTTVVSMEEVFYGKIRRAKQRASSDPRNPVAWADLARRYTGLAQFEKARGALRVARLLAPDSRYLLRVTARFLLHIGANEEAVRLLRASPRTPEDPWLLAALMAAATIADEPLPGRRVAQRILDRGLYRQIETAELVSELGTLELRTGSDKRARKLMLESLISPTDNSLAQARWAAPKIQSLEVNVQSADVAFPHEAIAWDASHRGDWDVAFQQSAEWLADQPFDPEAAIHASYVAAMGLDQWEDSLRLAEIGLRANPDNATLANNRAYALIELGRLDDADLALRKAVGTLTEKSDRVAISATSGLYEFRREHPEQGRSLYRQAIDIARRLRDDNAEATARAMLIREEVRVGGSELGAQLAALDKLAGRLKAAGVLRCVDRAHALAGGSKRPAR